MRLLNLSTFFILFFACANGQSIHTQREYEAPAAHQAVGVDDSSFYAIGNRVIEKYYKDSGKLILRWQDSTGIFKHLNSGVIIDGKLYCAHSNFPENPMTSSIEIFDPQTLEPIGSHSFGIDIGSATWIDFYDDHWYVAFAHYNQFADQTGKDNRWTQVVKFTTDWVRKESWILPADLIRRFESMSNSGGLITAEGRLLLTGHDFREIYVLEFPEHGSTIRWIQTIAAPFEGQGIAADPEDQHILYGISRSQKKVIQARWEK